MLFYKWSLYRRILKYSAPIISAFERNKIAKYGRSSPAHPFVFILGAPRTGSTILYQLITNLYDALYVDNLVNLARQNPYFGFWLSEKLFRYREHNSFSSNYGDTSQEGLHAPCEGLFWYKWLPKDRHYTQADDLGQKQILQFRQTMYSIINRFGKPFIIKNLSFSMRLSLLKGIFPEAKYIVMHRDPLYSAQSLKLAKEKNDIPDQNVWGILPKNFEKLISCNPHEQVVKQIYLIDQQISQDLQSLSKKNVLHVNYEDLDSGLESIMNEVGSFIHPDLTKKPHIALPEIKIRNEINLPDNDIQKLKRHILELDWIEFKTQIDVKG